MSIPKKDMRSFIYEGAAIVGQVDLEEKKSDTEEELSRLIRDKEVFVVKISGMRDDAVTANVLGDYMGIVPKAQVSNRLYVRKNMDELIGQHVPVIAKAYDKKEKTVKLSRIHAVRIMQKTFLDEIIPIIDDINEGLEEPCYKVYENKFEDKEDPAFERYPRVKAKVMHYDHKKKRILVNIAGLDLLGYMDISKFDYKYIYNPEKFIEDYIAPNTVIEVAVLNYFKNPKEPYFFIVSRRHTLKDPWEGIEKKIRKNDIIVVKALEKKDSHFFGKYDNFPLDIKCYYPPIPDRPIGHDEKYGRRLVSPGKEYKVKIASVNPKTRVLTASFVEEL